MAAADRCRPAAPPLELLVLVLVLTACCRGADGAEISNSSVDCTGKPDSVVGLGHHCTCEVGCDADQNLRCVGGFCLCTPGCVVYSETCLLKGHYNESCDTDLQCQDANQLCGALGRCDCRPGFRLSADPDSPVHTVCRPLDGEGVLGSNCSTVADCNWELEHVACSDSVCQCQVFYYGDVGDTECRSREWVVDVTWIVTVGVIAVVLIAVGVGLLLSCAIKECLRSHQRMRGRVIAVHGPADKDSTPPPPYITVVNTKPPAYQLPSVHTGCIDNHGFTPCELEPYRADSPW